MKIIPRENSSKAIYNNTVCNRWKIIFISRIPPVKSVCEASNVPAPVREFQKLVPGN